MHAATLVIVYAAGRWPSKAHSRLLLAVYLNGPLIMLHLNVAMPS
jgi:hypothetical protein